METLTDFIFSGKITEDGYCSLEIKRLLFLGRKGMTNVGSLLKSRGITLLTTVRLVKAMVFPVFMNGCESWMIKKAQPQRNDAFELWCWRRLFRVPWTARTSNQAILKEISPEYSLEGWCWSWSPNTLAYGIQKSQIDWATELNQQWFLNLWQSNKYVNVTRTMWYLSNKIFFQLLKQFDIFCQNFVICVAFCLSNFSSRT